MLAAAIKSVAACSLENWKSGNGSMTAIRGPVTAEFLGLGRQGGVSGAANLAVHRYREPRDRLPGFQALLGVCGAIQDKPDRILV